MNIIKKERLIALALVFAMLITVYIVALYKLQIIEGEKYYEESRNNMVTTSTVTAARGNIVDSTGKRAELSLTATAECLLPINRAMT